MIQQCHRITFERVCRERGRDLGRARECIVAQDGDIWTIDTAHPEYPRAAAAEATQEPYTHAPRPPAHGPGTELKKLLGRLGIHATEGCSCNFIATQMNIWGAGECEEPERMQWVLDGMRENAASRGLPFVEFAARILVKRAIKLSRMHPNEGAPPIG